MSNNNATVAFPGNTNWAVWWSPQSGFDNFQLDIVGFLAVLGENAVLANAQVAALSRLFYLPRLIPAPQALLRTTRPTTLPPTTAKVTGVYSGNVKDHVHHIANILLGDLKAPYSVKHVKIQKNLKYIQDLQKRGSSLGDRFLRGSPKTDSNQSPPLVRGEAIGPLFWVTLIGVLEVVALFICSIVFGDGMSLVATILLGGLSTVAGICNKWTLRLSKRIRRVPRDDGISRVGGLLPPRDNTPKGDAVIRYPNGSYIIVECEEEVARELFFAPEEIEYNIKSEQTYRLLSLVGTVMLMLGVIALANSKLQLQIAWAGAFIIINIAHWVAAALPHKKHWDLRCYDVQKQMLKGSALPAQSTFTLALWKAILVTQSTAWVRLGGTAPSTPAWDQWLEEARTQATSFSPKATEEWDPSDAWYRLNEAQNGPPAAEPRGFAVDQQDAERGSG